MGMKSFGLRHALLMGAAAFGFASAATTVAQPAYAQEATRSYNIPAQDLDDALREFGRQTGRDVLFTPDAVAGKRSPGVQGQLTERQALQALLMGSGLRFEQTASNGYAVQDPNSPTRLGDASGAESSEDGEGYSEILVIGRPTLNADIRRSEDDAQPYVVFDSEDIQASGASNLEDFLRYRLPMNSQQTGLGQSPSPVSNVGGINLRGLGTNQTLVLVDGRRLPNVGISSSEGMGQPNINGIPTSSIERIEILPATAGGVYGGGATGGVVNIILKQNYSGLEAQAARGFEGDDGRLELGINGGFNLNDGNTRIMLTANHAEQEGLNSFNRNYARRSRELILRNNPTFFAFQPFGFTPNIQSLDGSDLVLDDGTLLGAPNTSVPLGYAGPGSSGTNDGGTALVGNAGSYNLNSPRNERSLLEQFETDTASFTIRQRFTPNVEVFLDLSAEQGEYSSPALGYTSAYVPGSDPGNPFQQDVFVYYSAPNFDAHNRRENETLLARFGLLVDLSADWRLALEQSWGRTTWSFNTYSFSGVTAPTEQLFRDTNVYQFDAQDFLSGSFVMDPLDTTSTTSTARLSGPVLTLPAGPIVFTGLVERREDTVDSTFIEANNPAFSYYSLQWLPQKSVDVNSLYGEVRVPIASPMQHLTLLRELELLGAIRYDAYETRSPGPTQNLVSRDAPLPALNYSTSDLEATSYTLGVRYAPTEDIAFRASFATGFLPPSLLQITTSPTLSYSTVLDPQRGNTSLSFPHPVLAGGSIDLSPEDSESQSYGFILTPRMIPGFRFSADYTRIEKTGEIAGLPDQYFVDHEADFPDRIQRDPLSSADQALGYTAGPITSIDTTYLNLARTNIEAWDFQVDYEIRTNSFGTWRPYIIATHQTLLERRTLPSDPSVDRVGLDTGPLEWRGNFGVTWEAGAWSAGWNAQYYDSYNVCQPGESDFFCDAKRLSQGSDTIPSQTYHDLFVSYRSGDTPIAALSDIEITLSVQNFLDTDPPIAAFDSTGGTYSGFADPRQRRFLITLHKRFS